MEDPKECSAGSEPAHADDTQPTHAEMPADSSRRSFLGTVGGATAALAVGLPLEPLFEGKRGQVEASVVSYRSANRANNSFQYRRDAAQDKKINVGVLPDNGDMARFTDFSGNWSKALKHDAMGMPNARSYGSLLYALSTGRFQDFENILVGTPGGSGFTSTLNGPQGCLAFDLEGLDSHAANGIPPAPSVTSAHPRPRRWNTIGERCCATCTSPTMRRIRSWRRRSPT